MPSVHSLGRYSRDEPKPDPNLDESVAVLSQAEHAGARILKPGTPTAWGGYSGYFADPDEHLWEVAHNPSWVLHPDGRTTVS